jgi:hypothetical protein
MSLVLCTVTYNIRGISVVLQVPQDSTNPAEKGKYLDSDIHNSYDINHLQMSHKGLINKRDSMY